MLLLRSWWSANIDGEWSEKFHNGNGKMKILFVRSLNWSAGTWNRRIIGLRHWFNWNILSDRWPRAENKPEKFNLAPIHILVYNSIIFMYVVSPLSRWWQHKRSEIGSIACLLLTNCDRIGWFHFWCWKFIFFIHRKLQALYSMNEILLRDDEEQRKKMHKNFIATDSSGMRNLIRKYSWYSQCHEKNLINLSRACRLSFVRLRLKTWRRELHDTREIRERIPLHNQDSA